MPNVLSFNSLHTSIADSKIVSRPAKAKKTAVVEHHHIHVERADLRTNGLGMYFLTQLDFSVLENIDNFEHDKDGLFTIRSAQEYLGMEYATIRLALRKLCSWGILFSTGNPVQMNRLRFGPWGSRVEQTRECLEYLPKFDYFGLKLSEQSLISFIKVMVNHDQEHHRGFPGVADLQGFHSSIAPDIVARTPLIRLHARCVGRFLTSERDSQAYSYSVTQDGIDLYHTWRSFSELVVKWRNK